MALPLAYVLTMAIGIIAALAELLSRYKDAPVAAATTAAGLAYMAFNAAIAGFAFFLIHTVFPMYPDSIDNPALSETLTEILLAGTASMAIMRSSFFTARVGGQDVEVGLAGIIQIFRFVIDRNVDRVRAGPRATEVAEKMKDVSFERAYRPLTSMCLNLLQNVSAEERARIEQQVEALANQTDRSDDGKALELGLILAGSVGFEVLNAARTNLRDGIATGTTRKDVVLDAVRKLDFATMRDEMPLTCLGLARELSESTQQIIAQEVPRIVNEDVSDKAKALNIGLLLAHMVGEEAFSAAVAMLEPEPDPTLPAQPMPGTAGSTTS